MSEGVRLDLSPEDEKRLKALAKLRQVRAKNEERWSTDAFSFLAEAVYTIDQQKGADGGARRKWPGGAINDLPCQEDCPWHCRNYLEHLVRCLQSEPKLLMPKSRRLLISWTVIAYAYWKARYHEHQLIAFASQKRGHHDGEGSAELVKRAWHIHRNLPPEADPLRTASYSLARLQLDNGSEIVGVAQGPDQARQYTYTCYVADEFAFWEWAGNTYHALLPTLEGGGQFIGLTTANPGFAEHLVYDRWNVTGSE